MDKVKYEKAKELEYKIEFLKKHQEILIASVNRAINVTLVPEFISSKIEDKIKELIKNEISLLEEEFNSL